ncbi:TraR/DksA C4-type zinc finger protein [Gracilibacillus alcaliphilus]|uniref:TraR/DksA C4-type zinc finger protein n=1 Tax=Gracilibacillus alcaliphilus TaxID=1401441 RepID=UPI00195C24CE|nr:TraR/DksA C4-type zinc finger protein [Gracilibacillus alcaliphilus]MBM7679348.1 YteA family regulatory protein [Gracilibacillus alcaliphilus]
MLHPKVLQQCKSELLIQRQEIKQQLQNMLNSEQSNNKAGVSELSNYDNHPGDTGSELFEREKDIALHGHAEKALAEIDHALEAIDNNIYGICEVCHQEIPAERMKAIPTTTRCVLHASNQLTESRPAEEGILHASIDEERVKYDGHIMFDREDSWQQVEQYGSSDGPSDFYNTDSDHADLYYHAQDQIGSVEELEGFLLADLDGKYIGVNEDHKVYEDYLDDHDITSILNDE